MASRQEGYEDFYIRGGTKLGEVSQGRLWPMDLEDSALLAGHCSLLVNLSKQLTFKTVLIL